MVFYLHANQTASLVDLGDASFAFTGPILTVSVAIELRCRAVAILQP